MPEMAQRWVAGAEHAATQPPVRIPTALDSINIPASRERASRDPAPTGEPTGARPRAPKPAAGTARARTSARGRTGCASSTDRRGSTAPARRAEAEAEAVAGTARTRAEHRHSCYAKGGKPARRLPARAGRSDCPEPTSTGVVASVSLRERMSLLGGLRKNAEDASADRTEQNKLLW